MTNILHYDPVSGFLMKTTLSYAIVFEEVYSEKFVVTLIEDIMKEMMGSEFLTGMSVQFYYQ